jgi:hypothetical protein
MAKKKNKKNNKKVPVMTNEQRFLTTLIKYTERNIRNDDSDLDAMFKQQASKLKKQLEALK